jgi:Lipid A 3-O-deacylase (PagL)
MASIFKYLSIVFIFLTSFQVSAQKKPLFYEVGFQTGFGYGINSLNLPEGNYRVLYFQSKLSIAIAPKKISAHPIIGKSFLYFEPQVNPVRLISDDNVKDNLEFGINVGLQQNFILHPKLHIYILAAVGPHYFTAQTERQSDGFIFSDCMGIGAYYFIDSRLALNINYRIRHLSNADTRSPNFGINTNNYHIGLSWFISK